MQELQKQKTGGTILCRPQNKADDLIHPAAHTAHRSGRSSVGSRSILLLIGNERVGGQDHRSDGGRVLKCRTGNLCRVDDTLLDHIAVGFVVSVKTDTFLGILYLLNDNAALETCVLGDLADRLFERADNDLNTCLLYTYPSPRD